MKTMLGAVMLVCSLAGCAVDLDKSTAIAEPHRNVARHMVKLALENCVVKTSYYGSDRVLSDSGPISNVLGVKRLYISGDAWYKAEMASSNLWNNFYYNATTQAFFCGDQGWSRRDDAAPVVFEELRSRS
jgi:hypothetical protein